MSTSLSFDLPMLTEDLAAKLTAWNTCFQASSTMRRSRNGLGTTSNAIKDWGLPFTCCSSVILDLQSSQTRAGTLITTSRYKSSCSVLFLAHKLRQRRWMFLIEPTHRQGERSGLRELSSLVKQTLHAVSCRATGGVSSFGVSHSRASTTSSTFPSLILVNSYRSTDLQEVWFCCITFQNPRASPLSSEKRKVDQRGQAWKAKSTLCLLENERQAALSPTKILFLYTDKICEFLRQTCQLPRVDDSQSQSLPTLSLVLSLSSRPSCGRSFTGSRQQTLDPILQLPQAQLCIALIQSQMEIRTGINPNTYQYFFQQIVQYLRERTNERVEERIKAMGESIGSKMLHRLLARRIQPSGRTNNDIALFIQNKVWPEIFSHVPTKVEENSGEKCNYTIIQDKVPLLPSGFLPDNDDRYSPRALVAGIIRGVFLGLCGRCEFVQYDIDQKSTTYFYIKV